MNDFMPLLSIIVPVYKTENYLLRCIDSITTQKYKELEIILVDDGSPDNCPKICDEYARKDSRVKVIHKENAGVSAARNSGLEIATGDYITFVDSDDYIESDMYQSMMNIVNQYDCDFVLCDCMKDFDDHSEIYSHDIRSGYYSYEQLKEEYYPHLLMMENVEYPATISNWLCLFKKSLLVDESGIAVRYAEEIRFSEDLLFGAQVMYNAKSFYYMKGKAYYHYVMRENSATHIFQSDKWLDYKKLYFCAKDYFLNRNASWLTKQLDIMLLFFVLNSLSDIRTATIKYAEKRKLKQFIICDKEVQAMFCRIRILSLPISTKFKIKIFAYKHRIAI